MRAWKQLAKRYRRRIGAANLIIEGMQDHIVTLNRIVRKLMDERDALKARPSGVRIRATTQQIGRAQ